MGDDKDKNGKRKLIDVSLSPININNKKQKHTLFLSDSDDSNSEIENENEEPGTIMQEIQPGYMFGERLLRPSFVAVSKKKTPVNKEKNEKK